MGVINLAQTGFMAAGVYAAIVAARHGSAFWLWVVTGAVAAAVVAALFVVIRFTHWGLVARMVMANEPLARGLGVSTVRVRQVTFLVGSLLAGLAGALLGPIEGVTPYYATALVAPAFLAV